MDKSKVTTRVLEGQKITNGGWNSNVPMKNFTESTISDQIKKMKDRAKAKNTQAMKYFNESMKTSRKEQLKKAYPEIQWPPKKR